MQRRIAAAAALMLLLPWGAVRAQVGGTQVAERVTRVMSTIRWAESLDAARETARKEKKLVFYLQIVGELDGGL